MSKEKERVVILTGASRGIGLSTTTHLLSHSHNVLTLSRTNPPALQQLFTHHGPEKMHILTGDVADAATREKAVSIALEKWGRVDALVVNHGGLGPVKRIGESSVEEWKGGFEGAVFGAVGMVQLTLPSLRTSPHARIILTSSGASITAYQGWACYGAGKAVLNHLAMTLAVEEPDITTISVRPGVVDTEMQREIRDVHGERMSEKDREKFKGLKRDGGLLRPEQPGNVIARLAVGGGEGVEWEVCELE